MTFLAPAWLALGAAVALALVALHLLAIGRPPPLVLPTARFVPERAARARRLARRPTNRLLLAMRVGAALLAAAALARPTRAPDRRPVARVIVADRSAAARDTGAVGDSVRALAGTGDLLIAFDTIAAPAVTLGAAAAGDSVIGRALAAVDGGTGVPHGRLSVALAAARRAAPALREASDSIELVIVSPLTSAEVDAATPGLRASWAGRARVVRVAPAAQAASPAAVRVIARQGGVPDDALAAAAGLVARSSATARVAEVPTANARERMLEVGGGAPQNLGSRPGSQTSEGPPPTSTLAPAADPDGTMPTPSPLPTTRDARVVRDGPTAADVAWARDSGGVLLDWPIDGVPNGWTRRPRPDSAGAIASGSAVFVAPLLRRAAPADPRARVIARWADGERAAVERPTGAGCVREVAVTVPQVGDAALRPPFLALLAALTTPCAHRTPGAPLGDADVRALVGRGPLLATGTLAAPAAPRDPLARWLLAAAITLLVLELPLRRIGAARDADVVDESPRVPSAARESAA